MKVVINGIGIAGPTLAYWLTDAGHDVLLVENAPKLRSGGYIIDFWGIGYDIAERMKLLPRIQTLGYHIREVRFVDQRGRRNGGFFTDVIRRMVNDRFTSVRRSDLSAEIYGALNGAVETRFDETIEAIEEHADCTRVHFRSAAPRDVDLVIGADGLHSGVRRIAFGPQSAFEVPLGYHVAAFEVAGYQPRDDLVYVSHAVPGRQISRFAMRDDKTLFLFIFRDEYLAAIDPDLDQNSAVAEVFADVGWECPQILSAMAKAPEVYFDSVSQIRMEHWTRHSTALIGDAAACVSLLAGEGTGLAMAEAFVLARALRRYPNDRQKAFDRYEECLMPFLRRKQASAARFASSFAPKTAFGISVRNGVTRLLKVPGVANFFIGRDLRDDFSLLDCEL
jgi:2-polyprenyl-6-methoxyphenol hydroxylase-like FAD-dependent oxidoreductase